MIINGYKITTRDARTLVLESTPGLWNILARKFQSKCDQASGSALPNRSVSHIGNCTSRNSVAIQTLNFECPVATHSYHIRQYGSKLNYKKYGNRGTCYHKDAINKIQTGNFAKSGKKTAQFLQVINYKGAGTGVSRTERDLSIIRNNRHINEQQYTNCI